MPLSDQARAELDAEVRRRYDRDALVRRAGDIGAAMAGVIDVAAQLSFDQRQVLHRAYEEVAETVRAAGRGEEWEEAFTYWRPFPEHPGTLYAIDPWCRAAYNYAVLVSDPTPVDADAERAEGPTTVARAAAGMVMALSVDLAAAEGWFHPIGADLADLLRRPWTLAVQDPRFSPPPAPPAGGL